jgi:uncharacterized protein (TIGR03437 family)
MKPWRIAFLLILLLTPVLSAATLLTNDIPVSFILPAVATPTLFNGALGYAIYVPPGAGRLTVVYDPDDILYVSELALRFEFDVGYNGIGVVVADYRTGSGAGTRQLEVTPQSNPPLQAGTYFIGFNVFSVNGAFGSHGTVRATVEGGSVPPLRTVAISNFDKGLDGWSRNAGPSDLPGASQGDPNSVEVWREAGGNPGGYIRYEDAGGGMPDALVGPPKFLGNLAALTEPRFEFDMRDLGGFDATNPVELRIFGAGAAYSWTGSLVPPFNAPPPYPPAPTFPPGEPSPNPPLEPESNPWRHYTASLQSQNWSRIAGDAFFSQALANVQRLELITDLGSISTTMGIDNVALRSRGEGPPPAVLAGNTSFSAGPDGWTRNYPASALAGATTGNADSTFRWAPFEGNPTGYNRLNSSGGPARDYMVAPAWLIGDYTGISNPRFELDYLHISGGTATRPIEIRLIGADAVFVWTGPVPTNIWTHYVVPLGAVVWPRVSGSATFLQALANVQRIEISMQQQSQGAETNALDNFWLLPGDALNPAPPALSANPLALSFTALVRGDNPPPQPLHVTSIGGGLPVSFTAAVTSNTSWLRLSAVSGTTPQSVNVLADLTNLGVGAYTGRVTVTPLGPGMLPQTVEVSLTVEARPGPTPRINTEGIVNAASNRQQLSPGSLGALYGSGLGPVGGALAAYLPGGSTLPTRVQGVRLLVLETYGALIAEAPLLYVGENQINFQLPFETFGRSEVRLVVDNNGNLSDPVSLQVVSSSPGVFTWAANRAVAINPDNSVNTSANAVYRGDYLTVYMTGQGVVTPTLPTGSAAPSKPLVRSPLPAKAWIGGAPAQIQFLGLTPGLVGVLQLNVVVPYEAPLGDSPLVVNINGSTSNEALVSVR